MKTYPFIIVLLLLTCGAIPAQDYDGDGLVGADDRYPLLAAPSQVSWEIKKIIFTWDVDLRWRQHHSQRSAEKKFTRTTFAFGQNKRMATRLQGEVGGDVAVTVNPFRWWKSGLHARADLQIGIQQIEHNDWQQSDSREVSECFQALAAQAAHIRNPHWEITVWIRNRTGKNLIAENWQVSLLDASDNVISYAVPAISAHRRELRIPARRNVPIQFRGETNTAKALEQIHLLQGKLPIFALGNSLGTLYYEGDRRVGSDLISKMQRMYDKTTPLIFEYAGCRVSWRVARFAADNQAVTVEQALRQIDANLRQVCRRPFCLITNGKLVSLAGYSIRQGRWSVTIDNRRVVDFLNAEIGHSVVFRYQPNPSPVNDPGSAASPPRRAKTIAAVYLQANRTFPFVPDHGWVAGRADRPARRFRAATGGTTQFEGTR